MMDSASKLNKFHNSIQPYSSLRACKQKITNVSQRDQIKPIINYIIQSQSMTTLTWCPMCKIMETKAIVASRAALDCQQNYEIKENNNSNLRLSYEHTTNTRKCKQREIRNQEIKKLKVKLQSVCWQEKVERNTVPKSDFGNQTIITLT